MKKVKGFNLGNTIVIMIITALVSAVTTGVIMLNNISNNKVNCNEINEDEALKEFINIYNTLLSKYYDNNIDKEGMLKEAESAMINYLGDKYTTYLDNDKYDDILDELSDTYEGIGVTINDNMVIVAVTDNSPAQKAGMQANDIIKKIDSNSVEGKTSKDIGELIKKGNNKEVKIEVERNGVSLNFTIQKEKLVNQTVSHKMLENNIGYLNISIFSKNLEDQVKENLQELEKENLRGLIIDLRNNVGGFLNSAESTASLFLEQGKVIYGLKTSNNKFTYKDTTKEKRTYPIVVLINNQTASAAEILASALKYSYGATLLGTRSYGKGVVQQVTELSNGDSMKYTTAEWLTPTGTCIDKIGLTPDIEVVYTTASDQEYDSQIASAVKVFK